MKKQVIQLNGIQDVKEIVGILVNNNYKVTIEPIYEAYWKQKISAYKIIYEEKIKLGGE